MTTTDLTPAQKGALTKKARYGDDYMRSIGANGGATTVQKHGPAHMSAIGRMGLDSRVQQRWQGDYQAYYDWLVALSLHATDPAPWNGAFPHPGDEPAPFHLVITPALWNAHFHPSEE